MMKIRYFVIKEEFLMATYPMLQSFQHFYQRIIKETLCSLREKYWVARGCQVVKREIHMCNVCGKLEGSLVLHQIMHPSQTFMSVKNIHLAILVWILMILSEVY